MRKLQNHELARLSVEQFKTAPKHPITVLLDDIRSMHNVGSVFRSADAFAISKIVLTGITPKPPHRDIHKVALGATESMDWVHHSDPMPFIRGLDRTRSVLVSLEQADRSISLNEFEPHPDMEYVVVFGNEVNGVRQEIFDQSDVVLEIPQFGTKHSLNVSVSVGIVLWDLVSKLRNDS